MQTFLPYPDFIRSAEVLDYRRLGKQRVETKQILLAINNPDYGWQNHPAVTMWRGYSSALAWYGRLICREWVARGYKDSLLSFFIERCDNEIIYPAWFGREDFHASHRSNLLRKFPEHYRKYWPDEPDNIEYVWPV